jgi:integrase
MPRKFPKYVDPERRDKTLYLYFRRDKKSKRIPLPPISSPEFDRAYAAALAGQQLPAPPNRYPIADRTIAALIASYKRVGDYPGLRATTKVGYNSRLAAIQNDHGHRSVAGLTNERVRKMLAPYANRPGAAHSLLKMLRILIKHAIAINWLNADPSVGIKRAKLKEIRSWTDEEIAAFEARWPTGSRERLAFGLHLYTGQRRSDVHRMTWRDISSGRIAVVQQKTGKKLQIRIHPELQRALDAAPRGHLTILNTAYGKPFSVDGFSGFMRDAIRAAELPEDCQPHGLRKAAGRRLAEAGCSAKQIMAVLGHKTLAEAERYVRDADEIRLGDQAIAQQIANQKENKFPKTTWSSLGSRN